MKVSLCAVVLFVFAAGCGDSKDSGQLFLHTHRSSAPESTASTSSPASPASSELAEARRGFVTKLLNTKAEPQPVSQPPANVFRLIKYASPVGDLSAYLTPDPGDGRKHPAIIWITGGDCNSIDEVWKTAPRNNDQTAAAYRPAS
jgi:hypothetical protein